MGRQVVQVMGGHKLYCLGGLWFIFSQNTLIEHHIYSENWSWPLFHTKKNISNDFAQCEVDNAASVSNVKNSHMSVWSLEMSSSFCLETTSTSLDMLSFKWFATHGIRGVSRSRLMLHDDGRLLGPEPRKLKDTSIKWWLWGINTY